MDLMPFPCSCIYADKEYSRWEAEPFIDHGECKNSGGVERKFRRVSNGQSFVHSVFLLVSWEFSFSMRKKCSVQNLGAFRPPSISPPFALQILSYFVNTPCELMIFTRVKYFKPVCTVAADSRCAILSLCVSVCDALKRKGCGTLNSPRLAFRLPFS